MPIDRAEAALQNSIFLYVLMYIKKRKPIIMCELAHSFHAAFYLFFIMNLFFENLE
jgi:hypothetical protein